MRRSDMSPIAHNVKSLHLDLASYKFWHSGIHAVSRSPFKEIFFKGWLSSRTVICGLAISRVGVLKVDEKAAAKYPFKNTPSTKSQTFQNRAGWNAHHLIREHEYLPWSAVIH